MFQKETLKSKQWKMSMILHAQNHVCVCTAQAVGIAEPEKNTVPCFSSILDFVVVVSLLSYVRYDLHSSLYRKNEQSHLTYVLQYYTLLVHCVIRR